MKRIFEYKFLVPLHPLNNIEITNYFNDECRNNLPRLKMDVINLDDKIRKGTHWVYHLLTKH